MKIREYSLPPGWYPRDLQELSPEIRQLLTKINKSPLSRAVISPHAGWYFCGRLIARAVSALEHDAETIVVLGGHLPGNIQPLFAMEDAAKTPFGSFPIDIQLRSVLLDKLNGKEDRFRDNTIEVLLPMVRYFFPKSMFLWLRLPAEIASFEAGKIISRAAADLNRKINVIASADLTHYGVNYGFTPKGSGVSALNWVRDVNDAGFIRAVESGNLEEVFRRAEQEHASCSAGAVLGVMGFAQAEGLGCAQLLEYTTSADLSEEKPGIPDSFVGYAAMAF